MEINVKKPRTQPQPTKIADLDKDVDEIFSLAVQLQACRDRLKAKAKTSKSKTFMLHGGYSRDKTKESLRGSISSLMWDTQHHGR